MNNKKTEASCLTGWNDNAPDASLMPRVLAAREKMLHTSRLYLKVDQTKTESDLNRLTRTDHSKETQMVQ